MDKPGKPRRDFLYVATGAFAAIGVVALAKPLLGHMAPAGDSPLVYGLEVDLSLLKEGEQMTVTYLGKPVAIRHRTRAEISAAQADDKADLIHIETDRARLRPKPNGVFDPRFLVFYPICTHFGCVVVGDAGDFDGWYCPCHGAHFDTSGRVRKGPAPTNMDVPNYKWVSDTAIKLHRRQKYGFQNTRSL